MTISRPLALIDVAYRAARAPATERSNKRSAEGSAGPARATEAPCGPSEQALGSSHCWTPPLAGQRRRQRLAQRRHLAAGRAAADGPITPPRPCLAASSRRRSGWPTQRSSPVRPSSPKHALGAGGGPLMGTPRLALATASATARSHPGSSTRTPPTTFTNTSAPPVRTLAVTAEDREHQRQPVAVEPRDDPARLLELGRRHQRLNLYQQRPRPLHRREHDAAGGPRGLGDEPRRGVQHLDQPALAHLEQARLVGRSEAVLERPQLAIGALALALELQHAVHEVLEHARTGERAVLGDVPHEDHRHPARLGQLHDPRRHLAHLPDRARRTGAARRRAASAPSRSRTPAARLRPSSSRTTSRSVSARTGTCSAGSSGTAGQYEPLGAQPHLLRGLLAADVQRAVAGLLQVSEHHVRQRRLADPGRAAEQHQRAGHQAAAEDAIELADAGRHAPDAAPHRPPRAGRRETSRSRAAPAPRVAAGPGEHPAPRAGAQRAPPRACSTPHTPGTARATGRTGGRTESRCGWWSGASGPAA